MISFKYKNNLYRARFFWLAKKWLNEKLSFNFWKLVFSGHYRVNSSKKSASILWASLPSFFSAILYSVLIVLILELCNYRFPLNFLIDKAGLDKASIDTFLAAIASIMGVFLGLYFTAIASIASNFLVRATQNVRHFFLSAPTGQQYVKIVALTGIISVFYITTKSFGHAIHPWGLIFLSLIASYVVIQFWSIGSAVFFSLEPSNSFSIVTRDIIDSVKGVVPPGFRWQKNYFQNHYRRVASYYLERINDIITFGIEEMKLSDDELVTALKYMGGLLFFYPESKRKIPTNSFWYKTRHKFQSWTLADSSQISIALSTGTALSPEAIKDTTWFEEHVMDISERILKCFIDEKKIGFVYQGFEVFVEIAEVYGKDFDEQGIKMLFKKLETTTNSIYSIKITDIQQREYKEQLAIVESHGRLAIAALLGLTKYLINQSCEKISEDISRIEWTSSDSSIYLTGLPSAILPRLESIANSLKNELLIEGRVLSPEWYIKTLCIQQYLFSLQGYFNYLKSLHLDFFQSNLDKLLKETQLSLAVQLIQRWLEFSNKYNGLVSILRKHIEECACFHQVKDLPWVVFDFSVEEKIALDRENEVTDKMIQLLPLLKTLLTGDELPDYFGQALTSGVQACYEACEDNDHERLKSILPFVFDASLAAHDMTRNKVQNWAQEESKIIYSTEPLINLIELSGYAKLYSELYQNLELWNITQQCWDAYLRVVDANKAIQYIAAVVAYRNTLFMLMPQETLRTNWQMSFGQKMREQGLPVFPDYMEDYIDRNRRPHHQSALIRVLAQHGGLMGLHPAQEVFFAIYLSIQPAAEGIELPDRHDLREQIEREQRTQNNTSDYE